MSQIPEHELDQVIAFFEGQSNDGQDQQALKEFQEAMAAIEASGEETADLTPDQLLELLDDQDTSDEGFNDDFKPKFVSLDEYHRELEREEEQSLSIIKWW